MAAQTVEQTDHCLILISGLCSPDRSGAARRHLLRGTAVEERKRSEMKPVSSSSSALPAMLGLQSGE